MDPVTQAFNSATALITTAQQVAQLIDRLMDHGRTLAQAEEDYRKSGDRMDGPAEPTS